jgi:hypothetical protein
VPVWLERFALTLLASAFLGLVILNTLKFDTTQRWSLGIGLLAISVFVGQTLHLQKKADAPPVAAPVPAPQAETGAAPTPSSNRTPQRAFHKPEKRPTPSPAPAITQEGQNNIAQVGNNNQATINTDEWLMPREQQVAMWQALSANLSSATTVQIATVVPGNRSSFIYASQLANVFAQAGWKIEDNTVKSIYMGGTLFGVRAKGKGFDTGAGKAISDAFRASNIRLETISNPRFRDDLILIEVGLKP